MLLDTDMKIFSEFQLGTLQIYFRIHSGKSQYVLEDTCWYSSTKIF